jgi:hypothetical protein
VLLLLTFFSATAAAAASIRFLSPTSNDKLRCYRFSGVVAALLARDFPSGNAQVHFLPPKPHH